MSNDKKYYWIKLRTDFFNQDTIDFLMSQKNGCEYIVLYQMLCLNSANSNGQLFTQVGDMIIPYTVEKIVRDTKYFDFDTVTVALELFKKLGLVYETDDNIIAISNYENMIGSETVYAQKKREYRERLRQNQLQLQDNHEDNVLDNQEDNVRQEIRDKRSEIRDKIIDNRDENSTADKSACRSLSCSQIVDLFNDICVSYPKVRSISAQREKAVKARLRTYGIDKIKEVFQKAENSSFLKGSNSRDWCADFDWLMKENNFAKTLDGNYDDKKNKNQQNYNNSSDFNDPYAV